MSIRQLLNGKNLLITNLTVLLLLSACSSVPKTPKGIYNACDILNTHKSWRQAFNRTYKTYGVPPHVVMAIIYQESRFVAGAKPPYEKILGIPVGRASDAYGYAQALKSTWNWYKKSTGHFSADRENLRDAVDFIGFYIDKNYKRNNVSKWDAKKQYLAYHEGIRGYSRKTYRKKPWLIRVSDKVGRHASTYRQQLKRCYQFPR